MLHVGEEEPERGEQAGRRRHDDAAHLELSRHPRREERAVAAEREQRVFARITSALARHRADRAHHVRRRDDVRTVRGLGERQAHPPRDAFFEDCVSARRVELHGAARELVRV